MTPEQLEHEKRAVLAEIDAAFANVSRQGGISWSQSEAIDNWTGHEEELRARKLDTDRHWSALVANAAWSINPGIGGFAFLDAIGFRYYLPAAMKRCLMEVNADPALAWAHLELRPGDKKIQLKKWALLDQRQIRCIARFLACMDEIQRAESEALAMPSRPESDDDRDWHRALVSYWQQAGA